MSIYNLALQIPLSDYLSIYLTTILAVTIFGVMMIEWFDRRFDRLVVPICERIMARRAIVVGREKRQVTQK